MKRFLGVFLAFVLFAVGGWLVWSGFHQPPEEAPQLDAPISAPSNQQPVGPTVAPVQEFPLEEKGEPVTQQMDPASMAPNRLYIPALGVYARINQNTGDLVNGFLTLPQANEVTRWKGGSNVESTEGNILLAGHVSWNGVNGAIHNLAYIKAGNLAYVTDEKGNREEFQLQTAETIKKSELPASVWETTGDKKLVIVTCGGSIYRAPSGGMHFDSNVIATFVPVKSEVSNAPTLTASPTAYPS